MARKGFLSTGYDRQYRAQETLAKRVERILRED